MSGGRMVYVDEELDEQIENFRKIGDFQTKAEASERMGKIFEAGLKSMRDKINEEMRVEIGLDDEMDGLSEGESEENGFFEEAGIDHSMLGFD